MSTYGYQIVQTLIVDIEPDINVKRAMNEINAGNMFYFLKKNIFLYICEYTYVALGVHTDVVLHCFFVFCFGLNGTDAFVYKHFCNVVCFLALSL